MHLVSPPLSSLVLSSKKKSRICKYNTEHLLFFFSCCFPVNVPWLRYLKSRLVNAASQSILWKQLYALVQINEIRGSVRKTSIPKEVFILFTALFCLE